MRSEGICKELGRLTQDYKGTSGTDIMIFLSYKEIVNIPADCVVTYAHIVVDYLSQKDNENQVRLAVERNLIDYLGELTTNTVDLITTKILLNSVIFTFNGKFMTIGIINMYLLTPLDCYEYMCITFNLVPKEFINAYNLHDKMYKGFVYVEIHKDIY